MKFKLFLAGIVLFCSLHVNASKIGSKPGKDAIATMTEEEKKARLEEIKQRVDEIKEMDKSHLTSKERKQLRGELKVMKQEAQAIKGVYLSVGAIIIIILLLILIL